ncbi:MAG: type II CAAX prenyl endopeptidase Rce1 family protein, partial [Armatimonadaceae bacterium]
VDQDRWSELPQGSMSPAAVGIVSAVFALAHPEWLAAFVYGILMALVLRRTGKLGACLVAHVVTNLMLGIWVVARGAWNLW